MSTRFKLGVTGGIGSGKTTVCRVFNVLGIPVFSADENAREIMERDTAVADAVNSITGRNMYSAGVLDRKELAAIIFNNSDLLEKINKVVHPLVRTRFEVWTEQQESGYVIYEAAILIESGASENLDRILTVIAPLSERIERVMKRNSLTLDQIMDRVKNQSSDDYKISRSDYVINNSDNEMIIPEIIKVHNNITSYLKRR